MTTFNIQSRGYKRHREILLLKNLLDRYQGRWQTAAGRPGGNGGRCARGGPGGHGGRRAVGDDWLGWRWGHVSRAGLTAGGGGWSARKDEDISVVLCISWNDHASSHHGEGRFPLHYSVDNGPRDNGSTYITYIVAVFKIKINSGNWSSGPHPDS